MKQRLSKRELGIIILGIALVACLSAYAIKLHQDVLLKDTVIENTSKTLRTKSAEENETLNYIVTICAEYRKLYQSYREIKYPDPGQVDKYIGLPGSAKGQIDECYLPE